MTGVTGVTGPGSGVAGARGSNNMGSGSTKNISTITMWIKTLFRSGK